MCPQWGARDQFIMAADRPRAPAHVFQELSVAEYNTGEWLGGGGRRRRRVRACGSGLCWRRSHATPTIAPLVTSQWCFLQLGAPHHHAPPTANKTHSPKKPSKCCASCGPTRRSR